MIHCHAMIFSRDALGGVRRMVMGTRCQYMSGLIAEYCVPGWTSGTPLRGDQGLPTQVHQT